MDYMRKVIYLKKRENEVLMQGQGFARLEKRGDNFMLYLSVHDITLQGENPVYIVCEQDGGYKAFKIGMAEQADNWNFQSLSEDLPKELVLEKICGILMGKKEHYLSGVCPEYPGTLLYGQVEFEAKPKSDEPAKPEPELELEYKAEPVLYTSETKKEMETKKERKPEEEKGEGRETEVAGAEETVDEPQKGLKPEQVQEAKTAHEIDAAAESEPEPAPALKRDSFLRGLSEMYPFEDDEIEWCLQMRPEDFNQFPMEYWHYAKNSFLLEGFYNYRHIVYAHTEGKNYVGVPGQYIRREQYLAARFGFYLFKQVRRKKLSMGDYGYWLREL